MALLIAVLALLPIWVAAFWIAALRNTRFFVFLAFWSLTVVGIQALPSGTREALSVLAALLLTVVVWFAERLGLGSLTRVERDVVRRLDRAWTLGRSESREDVLAAIRTADDLLQRYPAVDVRWRAAIRILRRAWSRRTEIDTPSFITPTPARSFRIAGAVTSPTCAYAAQSDGGRKLTRGKRLWP